MPWKVCRWADDAAEAPADRRLPLKRYPEQPLAPMGADEEEVTEHLVAGLAPLPSQAVERATEALAGE